jgi:hypothetical protein
MTADVQAMLDLIERSRGDRISRLVEALADPDHQFTSAQVAFLMGTAARWAREDRDGEPGPETFEAGRRAGYLERCAEENAAYPPEPYYVVTSAGQDAIRVHRSRMGVDVVEPREGDHPGGPVDPW